MDLESTAKSAGSTAGEDMTLITSASQLHKSPQPRALHQEFNPATTSGTKLAGRREREREKKNKKLRSELSPTRCIIFIGYVSKRTVREVILHGAAGR